MDVRSVGRLGCRYTDTGAVPVRTDGSRRVRRDRADQPVRTGRRRRWPALRNSSRSCLVSARCSSSRCSRSLLVATSPQPTGGTRFIIVARSWPMCSSNRVNNWWRWYSVTETVDVLSDGTLLGVDAPSRAEMAHVGQRYQEGAFVGPGRSEARCGRARTVSDVDVGREWSGGRLRRGAQPGARVLVAVSRASPARPARGGAEGA